MFEPVQMRELLVERQQHVIHDQHTVLGVCGNPADLVRRETQVQGMHDGTRCRDAEITLQVRVVVPAQGGNPVSATHAQRTQRRRQFSGALVPRAIGMAHE